MDASSGTSPAQEAQEVADRLHSAAIHLLRRVRVRDVELGLRGPGSPPCPWWSSRGPMTVGELAAAEQVRSPTMTRLVDGLEPRGSSRASRTRAMPRSVLVRATPTGRLVLSRGRAARIGDLAARLAALEPRRSPPCARPRR